MVRLTPGSKGSLLLTSVVLWTIAGCSRPPVQQSVTPTDANPAIDALSSSAPASTPAAPQISEAEVYKQALSKAASAQNLSKSALSPDDWNLVASRWQQAIEGLKTLPATSPYRVMAKEKLTQFEKAFATAQKQADRAKSATARTTPGTLAGSQPLNVSSTVSSSASGRIFQAKIKRRAGGTPIIDVTFNGAQTFEMIVDTGASGTVITQEMADALSIRIIGKTKVNTASQTGVEVPLGFVESIAVGNAVVKDVIVAIGNQALDIGLLGHDFFNDYDVTVKRDVVEFRKR
ncbi:MAG: retropepsin-like aspartic protease [Leptolyngbyaceae cyanobacterium bins.302]|nr:retropepsin-like aspartic protease [Leptolyngbyaceae cyanobacterium bins.302]